MKIKHINLLFLFAAIFTNNSINGANNDPVYQVMSPEVATYTRYGNYSVNYYTGTPNISIPIHEIKEREFESQIYLQYDASGLLPNRDATSVGQNWTLICGGMITRQVRGIPDDKKISGGNVPAFAIGYWYGLRNNGLAKDSSYLKNINNYYKRIANGGMTLDLPYEHEPDLFTFNANGDSFKFIIGNDGNVKVLGNRSCKVDLSGLACQDYGTPIKESSITVTLDNGYKYIFGGQINSLEISYPLYTEQKCTPKFTEGIINAWYLKQVISPLGKPVATYNYMPQDISDNLIDQNYIQKNIYYAESDKVSFISGCNNDYTPQSSVHDETISFTKLVYLTSITTTLSTIDFSYSPSTHSQYGNLLGTYMSTLQQIFKKPTNQLDSIIVKYNGIRGKTIKFNYEIASNEVVSYPNSIFSSRRFLNNVTINNLEKYSFEYNNSSILPYPITKKIDLDGYYNGIANNSLFPTVNFNSWQGVFNIDFSNRKTVKEYATIGLLKKTTYPTGGYSTFQFEAHDYGTKIKRYTNGSIGDEIINESGYTGGARIKTITNSSGVTRSFDYKINGKSSGIYFNPQIYVYYDNYPFDNCSQVTQFGISGNSLFDVATIAEPHIAYSKVKETRRNISGSYSDSVLYNYSNYITNPDKYFCGPNSYSILTGTMSDATAFKAEMNSLLNFSSCELDRGQLIKEEKYNSGGKKVQVIAYKYNVDLTKYLHAVIGCRIAFGGNGTGSANAYATYLYSNSLTEKIDSIFSNNGNSVIITKTNNTYNSNNLLTETSTRNSKNDELVKKTKYPLDYSTFPNYQGIAHPIDMMKQLNMFNYPVEQKEYINSKLSNAIISTYLINKNTNNENTVRPAAIYKLNIQKPEVDFTCLSAGDANNAYTIDSRMSQEISYTYNPSGTIKEVYSPKTGISTTYLWGYCYQYPMAEIKNATYDQGGH